MPFKVKVKAATTSKVFVPGLGLFVPNEWADVSDEDAVRFESIIGVSLEDSGLEVKKTASKKKESE